MSDTVDVRLARKGQGEPRVGVAQQARVSHGLYLAHKAELLAAGFTEAEGDSLGTAATLLESAAAEQAEAKGNSKGNLGREENAKSTAKELIRKVRNLLPMVLRKTPVAGVDDTSFNAGGELGRSTAKLSAYLGRVDGAARKVDEVFKPYLGGKKVSELLAAAKKDLDQADTAQEVSFSGLPVDTQKIYEAKGRAVEAIEDLNRVARVVFDGNAVVASQFNKDVLLRARKQRAKKEDAPA